MSGKPPSWEQELQAFAEVHGLEDSALEPLTELIREWVQPVSSSSHPSYPSARHSMTSSDVLRSALSDDNLPSSNWLDSASSPDWITSSLETNNPATVDLSLGQPSLHKDIWLEQEELTSFQAGRKKPQERYQYLSKLGEGAMGEVHQVWDWELKRVVAMKVCRPESLQHPRMLTRFFAEARITAQLDHPNIVPVYELGQLEDGRFFFTMKEVKGRTLSKVIQEVHRASQDGRWEISENGWSLRRLIDVFKRVCEAVGYAHSRGVMHRDLKPANIMIGAHGEVYVMDWGLVKQQTSEGEPWLDLDESDSDSFESVMTATTRLGAVKGTPAFMPPEQARGENDRLDPRSDVYALGAILYNILSNHPPYSGSSEEVLQKVVDGPPLNLRQRSQWPLEQHQQTPFPPLPEELLDACEIAMRRHQYERFDNGDEVAQVIERWLDDIQKQDRVLAMVDKARYLSSEAQAQKIRSGVVQRQAQTILQEIPGWEKEDRKWQGWEYEKLSLQLQRESQKKQLEADQLLKAALMIVPDLEEAHATLLTQYKREHQEAEESQNEHEIRSSELALRHHLRYLSPQHEQYEALKEYLGRRGQLTLHTSPSGLKTRLYRFEEQKRRLVPIPYKSPGPTPIQEQELLPGSYLLELEVQKQWLPYPFVLYRDVHWALSPDGECSTLQLPDTLPEEGECLVPAGWFWTGPKEMGDNDEFQGQLWLDTFVIQKYQVTNREYLAFLNDLLAQGREEEALLFVPRERSNLHGQRGMVIYGRSENGDFCLVPDADGDIWSLDWPVFMVDWTSAHAYGLWWAEKTGKPWRLPLEVEWEKAARGVDGRLYPWGNGFDPSRCCMRQSHQQRALPVSIYDFPMDESIYGVRGTAGNVRDWCLDIAQDSEPALLTGKVDVPAMLERYTPTTSPTEPLPPHQRSLRGGAWDSGVDTVRLDRRFFNVHTARFFHLGFRLARSL